MHYQQSGIGCNLFGSAGATERSCFYEPNTHFDSWQLDPPTKKSVAVMTKLKCVSNIFIDTYQ